MIRAAQREFAREQTKKENNNGKALKAIIMPGIICRAKCSRTFNYIHKKFSFQRIRFKYDPNAKSI